MDSQVLDDLGVPKSPAPESAEAVSLESQAATRVHMGLTNLFFSTIASRTKSKASSSSTSLTALRHFSTLLRKVQPSGYTVSDSRSTEHFLFAAFKFSIWRCLGLRNLQRSRRHQVFSPSILSPSSANSRTRSVITESRSNMDKNTEVDGLSGMLDLVCNPSGTPRPVRPESSVARTFYVICAQSRREVLRTESTPEWKQLQGDNGDTMRKTHPISTPARD